MHLIKEPIEVDKILERKIKNTLMFLKIKENIINGNIISIPKTNIAYIEPHRLIINDIVYLFFNEHDEVYINTLEKSIPISELQNYIRKHKN